MFRTIYLFLMKGGLVGAVDRLFVVGRHKGQVIRAFMFLGFTVNRYLHNTHCTSIGRACAQIKMVLVRTDKGGTIIHTHHTSSSTLVLYPSTTTGSVFI